ncbi:hypothetical protein GCM10023213_14150 [Prosthecobacter algae]|uniref:Uncharacterized protein n=1 Tax=Prosthecobacter algae TaxID=1144682 RepID=A0ABP9NZ75_9BACT
MPKPPFISTALGKELRPIIRETMQAAPKRKWTLKALHSFLVTNGYPDLPATDVNAALLWNQSQGYVHFTYNHESEADEWHLTTRGLEA